MVFYQLIPYVQVLLHTPRNGALRIGTKTHAVFSHRLLASGMACDEIFVVRTFQMMSVPSVS